jgi:23S rRNA (cytosine1962-C5)-methyltransferase
MPAKASTRLRLRVTAAAEKILRAGHPWLFADSILKQNRAGQTGELAIIYDRKDRFLAAGLFDFDSPIRVRILQSNEARPIDRDWFAARLQAARVRREGLFDAETTGFRCLNGESDGWPGLVLDRYDTTLVLKVYTAAWMPRLYEMLELIKEQFRPERIILRLSRNIQEVVRAKWAKADGDILHGPPLESPIVFLETGLRFEADVVRGQKTGFFLDQRANRRKVGLLAKNRAVLNAFSFTGGFSLYAACGGANSITDLDLSRHALAGAQRNFTLNQSVAAVASSYQDTIQGDAFDWLASNSDRKFDLIILDPPSLAKRESERAGAIGSYGRLVSSGINHLKPHGILVACSCSAHVTAPEFFEAVRQAAKKSGRPFEELETTGHAPDHPATFKEAEYLKGIYLRF